MPGSDWEPDGWLDERRPDLVWTPMSCLLTIVVIVVIGVLLAVAMVLVARAMFAFIEANQDADSDVLRSLARLAFAP